MWAFIACLTLNAQELPAKWVAISQTAMSITGDAYVTESSLWFHHHELPLTLNKKLSDEELKAAANLLQATMNADTRGELYKTHLSRTVHLLGSNTLCGGKDTTWILMVHTLDHHGRLNLELAVFSGTQRPIIETDALDHSTSLCGTYWYQK